MAEIISPKSVQNIRDELRLKWPDAFDDGARCGFSKEHKGPREPGGYPLGFFSWPDEKQNAWYAGYNVGRIDRLRFEEEDKKEAHRG